MKSMRWFNMLSVICLSITLSVGAASLSVGNPPMSNVRVPEAQAAGDLASGAIVTAGKSVVVVPKKQIPVKQSWIQTTYTAIRQKLAAHYRIIGAGALSAAVLGGWLYTRSDSSDKKNNKGTGQKSGSSKDAEKKGTAAIVVKKVTAEERAEQNKKLLAALKKDDVQSMIAAVQEGASVDLLVPDVTGMIAGMKTDAEADVKRAQNWGDEARTTAQQKLDSIKEPKESGNTLLTAVLYKMVKAKDEFEKRQKKSQGAGVELDEKSYHDTRKQCKMLVDLLIQQGADVYASYTLMQGAVATINIPLFDFAILSGDVQIVRMFLEQAKASESGSSTLSFLVNRVNSDNITPLIFAMEKLGGHKNQEEIVTLLIEAGADVKTVDSDGKTVLMHAAQQGMEELVKLLVAKGVDINAQDKSKKTVLDYAVAISVDRKDQDKRPQKVHASVAKIVQLLLDKNIKTNNDNNAFDDACRNGHAQAVRLLLTRDNGKVDPVLYKQLLNNVIKSYHLNTKLVELVFDCEDMHEKKCVITHDFYRAFLDGLVQNNLLVDDTCIMMLLDRDKKRRKLDPTCPVFIEAVSSKNEYLWKLCSKTVLMWALEADSVVSDALVERIISETPEELINAQTDFLGNHDTALAIAARSKKRPVSCIKALLKAGARVGVGTKNAFVECCSFERDDSAALRLAKVAALCDAPGITPETYNDLVQTMTLAYNMDRLDTPLINMLMQKESRTGGFNKTQFMKATNKEGRNLLQVASKSFRDDIVKVLLESDSENVNNVDPDGNTPLGLAVAHVYPLNDSSKEKKNASRRSIIQLLVDYSADVNADYVKKGRKPRWPSEQDIPDTRCTILELGQDEEDVRLILAAASGDE